MKNILFLLFAISIMPSIVLAQSQADMDQINAQIEAVKSAGLAPQINPVDFNLDAYSDIVNKNVKPDIEEQVTLTAKPSIPRPNQLVTLEVLNYSTNLDRAKITWYINDKLVKSEYGARKYEVLTGGLGQQVRIKVVIEKPDGSSIERYYAFRPAEVDLIYEADTFVPPFYEGKAYFTSQSRVKIIAIPQVLSASGVMIKPENLIYKWYQNNEVVRANSGYGKQTFSYAGKILTNSTPISVEISTVADGVVAQANTYLGAYSPMTVIYEKNPIFGTLYERAVAGNFYLDRPEIEFEAVPYFFNKGEVLNRSTVYNWQLNGQRVNAPNQNSIVFRNEENQSGQSSINLSVTNTTLLQQAGSNFNLLFGDILNDFTF